jgi:hypothetical protein
MNEAPSVFLELLDVAKAIRRSRSLILHEVTIGRLKPDARTPRGVRLFAPDTVAAFAAARAARGIQP